MAGRKRTEDIMEHELPLCCRPQRVLNEVDGACPHEGEGDDGEAHDEDLAVHRRVHVPEHALDPQHANHAQKAENLRAAQPHW